MKNKLNLASVYMPKADKHLRHLPFRRIENFRDLGGYAAADGRSIRWGVLYRSGSLHKPTTADQKQLALLGLRTVVDFRAEYELTRRPDKIPAGVRHINIPMEDSSTKVWHEAPEEMVKNLGKLNPAKYMLATNDELASKFTSGYKHFFRELLALGGDPILFHCAAGKDRTGFAAAVLLTILGVPHAIALQDYLLTNKYLLGAHRWELFSARIFRGKRFADGIHGFLKADERYLSAAFERLKQDHGSFENYVRNGLGLDEHDVERLKNIYLE